MRRKWLAEGFLRVNGRTGIVSPAEDAACSAAISSSLAAVSNSSELQFQLIQKTRRSFRAPPAKLALQLLDLKLQICDQGRGARRLGTTESQNADRV
jgi:hypothetical protein